MCNELYVTFVWLLVCKKVWTAYMLYMLVKHFCIQTDKHTQTHALYKMYQYGWLLCLNRKIDVFMSWILSLYFCSICGLLWKLLAMTKPQRIVKSSHISLTSIALELYSRVKAAAIEVVWLFHSIVIRHIWPGMECGQWTSTYQLIEAEWCIYDSVN